MRFIILGLVSLFCAVVSTVFLLQPMLNEQSEEPVATVSEQQVTILVASSDIPQGKLLSYEDVAEARVLQATVPANYLPPGEVSLSQTIGKVSRVPISKGLPLTLDLLAKADYAGHLAAGVTEGFRAISILVDDASGVSGLVQPLDRVDVVLTSTITDSSSSDGQTKVSETILRNAKVVAVGARILPSALDQSSPESKLRTATLEVTPKDAERLILAQQIGTLSLLLIPLGSTEAGNKAPIDVSETGTRATEVSGDLARRAAVDSFTLEVEIVGGRQQKAKKE
jgi:pilus assembly protein CpaB